MRCVCRCRQAGPYRERPRRPLAASLNLQDRCRALPFCHLRIVVSRRPLPPYWISTQTAPNEPQTIGDHIKKRRLQLKMPRTHVCGIFTIHIETLKNWERNACTPSVRHIPAIIRFLGYVPFGHDGTPGGRLAFLRECVGLTQRQVAWVTGIDAVHLWRYERNTSAPDRGYREVWSHLVALVKRGKIWGPDLHAQLGRSRTS